MLHGNVHDPAQNVVRNFQRIALDTLVVLKTWYGRLQDRHHNIEECLARALLTIQFIGRVGGIVVAGNGQHRLSIEVIETNRALGSDLLLLFINIELPTQIKGIGEIARHNFLSHNFKIVHVFLLEIAQGRVFYLDRGDNLAKACNGNEQQHDKKTNTISAHTLLRKLDTADRKRSLDRRSEPGCPICSEYSRTAA